ncbi:hypothetical protein KKA17_10875 [bacterium]|nr:hypothetical protein [bacterium]MBU1883861.1 hypothetical protein [bacterium]
MKIVLAFLLLFSFAFGKEKHQHEEHEFHMPRDLGYLHLDHEQQEKISQILSKNSKKLQELHEQKELTQMKIKRLFLDDDFDKEGYTKLLMELKSESINIEADMFKNIHDVLTPKQRELFLYYIREWEVE